MRHRVRIYEVRQDGQPGPWIRIAAMSAPEAAKLTLHPGSVAVLVRASHLDRVVSLTREDVRMWEQERKRTA